MLTGPSVRLDARTHAVRGDLADVRLAEKVFAPHYAQPIACRVCEAGPLRESAHGDEIARMAKGDIFELLELAGGHAWGIAAKPGLVGYCDRGSLELA